MNRNVVLFLACAALAGTFIFFSMIGVKKECPQCQSCPVCPEVKPPETPAPPPPVVEEEQNNDPPPPPPPKKPSTPRIANVESEHKGVDGKDYNTDWVEDVVISPKYYQDFPIDRYPGMKCYVIVTSARHVVLTLNCDVVYVNSDNITIGNYVIPRQTPGKRCNRCYVADYTTILGFLLFGRPEMGIEPLAPLGMLLMEDDVILCNAALPVLDECFKGQYNCIVGTCAWANFYAGAQSEQPDPQYDRYRFKHIEDIYNVGLVNIEHHADWFIKGHRRHARETEFANHVGGATTSTLFHNNEVQIKCDPNDTLESKKVVVNRFKDIRMWYWNIRDNDL